MYINNCVRVSPLFCAATNILSTNYVIFIDAHSECVLIIKYLPLICIAITRDLDEKKNNIKNLLDKNTLH